jgi:hypothetical protein
VQSCPSACVFSSRLVPGIVASLLMCHVLTKNSLKNASDGISKKNEFCFAITSIEDLAAGTNKKGERSADQNSVHSDAAVHAPSDDA